MTKPNTKINVRVPKHAKVTSPRPMWQRLMWGFGGILLSLVTLGMLIEENFATACVTALFALAMLASSSRTYER